MIGDRLLVDLAQRAFLRANAAGEITEVIDSQRYVGGGRLADGLAVVDGFDERQRGEIVLQSLGDLVQDVGALRGGSPAPGVLGLVSRIQRQLHVG